MQLPEGWFSISREDAVKLEAELRREMIRSHALYGRTLRAVARRERRDDVLFRSDTDHGPVFVVHLTWSVETDPTWPWTIAYPDIDDFLERWPREELGDDPSEDVV